jgi:hypothetical protein
MQTTVHACLHADDAQPPDAPVEQAKAVAREEGRTLTSLVEQGLRTVLDSSGTRSTACAATGQRRSSTCATTPAPTSARG